VYIAGVMRIARGLRYVRQAQSVLAVLFHGVLFHLDNKKFKRCFESVSNN
jgi:hypothetical protein